MKIVLVGLGKIGSSIIQQISNEGHEVICIDNNGEIVDSIINTYDVMGITGNGSNFDILKEAQVNSCDVFIAATANDETNIISCILAKKLGAKKTVARIRNPEFHTHIGLLKDEFDIDFAINPEFETAKEIKKIIEVPFAASLNSLSNEKVEMATFVIKANSPLVNRSLLQIKKVCSQRILFTAVERGNDVIIPDGTFTLQEKDLVHIIGERRELSDFFNSLGNVQRRLKNILVLGGGKTSLYLISALVKEKYNVKVIEVNKERCIELNKIFPNIQVINADATDHTILLQEGIKQADALISLTTIDEENILIGMFAKRCNVKKIILKVNRDNLANMIEETTDMSIMTAKGVTANLITSYTRFLSNPDGNKVLNLLKFSNNLAEAIEFKIGDDCRLINTPLRSLRIKRNNLIACIIRNNEVIIPNGDDCIQIGDVVLVVSKSSNLTDINKIMR